MMNYAEEPKTVAELLERYRAVKRRLNGDPNRTLREPNAGQAERKIALIVPINGKLEQSANEPELPGAPARQYGKSLEPAFDHCPTPHAKATAVLRDVANRNGVPVEEILGSRRTSRVAKARHEAIWRVKNATNWSLPRVGRMFHRDHSSVLHAIRRMETLRATSPSVM